MYKIIGLATTFALLLGASSPAKAVSTVPEVSEIIERLVALEIPESQHEVLIYKIQNGVALDSDVAGSTPISVKVSEISGFHVTRTVFEDGSVSINSIENQTKSLSRASLNGCSISSGTGYKNYLGCTVINTTINVTLAFVASFGLVNGAADSIFAVSNPVARCYLGSCSSPVLQLVKAKESSSGPANASVTTEFVLAGGWASRTHRIILIVGNDKYTLDVLT